MSEIVFDIDSVLREARQKTGLDDFGDNDFIEGLGVLLETYDNNGYTEKGRKRNRRRVVDLLAARLRIEQAFKDYPQILDEKIVQPMYLTGLPRTGTSALLNLLANDPAARPLKLWEGMMPDPCENFQHGMEDPRYRMMKDWQDEQARKNPEFSKIHHTTADTPEECIHLLNHTFQDVQFGVETMMEPYGSWFRQQDLHNSYRYYANLLRMLQWQRPGDRWLLKSPCHLWALDIINDMFPDACIIITHRNPLEAVTSYCSMMAAMMKERVFDPKTLGPVVMDYLASKVESSLRQREHIDSSRILDLQFNDFVADSVGFVHGIYEYFRLPMSKVAQQQIAQYAADHPMGKHGKHEYDLQQYGLTEQQVLERFGFYIERFRVPMV
ncbi:MAG TPA: sulfotransferase [Pseudomonadales bacterium]